jgi:hypothetical protein
MLQTFTKYTTIADRVTTAEIQGLCNQIDRSREQQINFTEALRKGTANYVRTGIASAPTGVWAGWVTDGENGKWLWTHYFRQLAKEMHRPFVYYNWSQNRLEIQRRRSTEPLVAGFLLAARQLPCMPNYWAAPPKELAYYTGTRSWYIYYGNSTKEIIDAWCEAAPRDPAMRVALGLV